MRFIEIFIFNYGKQRITSVESRRIHEYQSLLEKIVDQVFRLYVRSSRLTLHAEVPYDQERLQNRIILGRHLLVRISLLHVKC